MIGPQRGVLPDGRLHLQHGPIDLVIEAFGAESEVQAAYRQASDRFPDILPTLVSELAILRRPTGDAHPLLQGPVARRMAEAVWPYRDVYITPMAAVAGAVADEMLAALVKGRSLDKAYVNNGGDIAFHLSPGHGQDSSRRERLVWGGSGNHGCPSGTEWNRTFQVQGRPPSCG